MNIGKYIIYCLKNHRQFYLPELGMFKSIKHSSRIDETTNKIYPASYKVDFDDSKKGNDGILASIIAVNEKISIQKAIKVLKSFALKFKKDLNANQKHEVKYLGIFKKINNRVYFNLYDSSIITTLSYLPTIKAIPVDTPQRPKNNIYTTIHSPLYKWLFFLLLILSLLFSVYYILSQNKSITNVIIKKKSEVKYIPAVTKKKKHLIILGAFLKKDNATNKIKTLELNSYTSYLLPKKHKDFYLVFLDNSFKNKEEAKSKLKIIQKELQPDAWILSL